MKAAIYALLLIYAILNVNGFITHKFLFSKETVVLRLWESETWKFGFIKRGDESQNTSVKDLKSLNLKRQPFVRENRAILGCCWFL